MFFNLRWRYIPGATFQNLGTSDQIFKLRFKTNSGDGGLTETGFSINIKSMFLFYYFSPIGFIYITKNKKFI